MRDLVQDASRSPRVANPDSTHAHVNDFPDLGKCLDTVYDERRLWVIRSSLELPFLADFQRFLLVGEEERGGNNRSNKQRKMATHEDLRLRSNGQRMTCERSARQACVSVNVLVSTPGAQSFGFL